MKPFLFLFTGLSLIACKDETKATEDDVPTVHKKQAVETLLSVEHQDQADILKTHNKVWVNHHLVKEKITYDTLPKLSDTILEIEDNNGVTRPEKMRQDYEFFITVQ